MKRVDMVDKIIHFVNTITKGKTILNSIESDILLTRIEQTGMVPPKITKMKDT
jgi:hypothetical protein